LNSNDFPTVKDTDRRGYRFVETPNPKGEGFLRYRLSNDNEKLEHEEIGMLESRYMVRQEDISTSEDRSFWVAGNRLSIIDMKSRQVLGERVGYVFESGFGSISGGRRPWLIAQDNACPPIARNSPINRLFLEKVLIPVDSRMARHQ